MKNSNNIFIKKQVLDLTAGEAMLATVMALAVTYCCAVAIDTIDKDLATRREEKRRVTERINELEAIVRNKK